MKNGQINVDFNELETLRCEGKVHHMTDTGPREEICGNMVFQEACIIKKIPMTISPSGTEQEFPIPVMVCLSCGKVRLPKSLRKDEEKKSPISLVK